MAGKGGGAWKVAYADFVTAMMAFFLVMWIVAQNKSVKEAVSGYFRDPFGREDKPAGSGHAVGYVPRSKMKSDDKGRGSGSGPAPKFEVLHDRHGTTIGASILFADDSSELDATAKRRLDDIVPLVLGKQNRMEIRAHTARRPTVHGAPAVDDWRLCYERSTAVLKYLEGRGVESRRLRLSLAGSNEPAEDATSELWRARNSRVEIIMMDEYFEDPKHPGMSEEDAHGGHGAGAHGDDSHGDAGHGNSGHDDAHGAKPPSKKTRAAAPRGHAASASGTPAAAAHGGADPGAKTHGANDHGAKDAAAPHSDSHAAPVGASHDPHDGAKKPADKKPAAAKPVAAH